MFQSPNGVQIAFVNTCILSEFSDSFNHQTVYRLLYDHGTFNFEDDEVSITKRCTDCFLLRVIIVTFHGQFQSPNGVQIALNTYENIIRTLKFQSPNGVQIAFVTMADLEDGFVRFQSPNGVQIALALTLVSKWSSSRVSITKRCTDCFGILISKGADRVKEVSITKRYTDCFIQTVILHPISVRFNHQTVYRLLFKDQLHTTRYELGFNHQTVYRLLYRVNDDTFEEVSFNHQTVYRLL